MKEVIKTLDAFNDPYGRRYYAAKKRRSFEKLKRTKEFAAWKDKQIRIQKHRCAYCEVDLTYKNIVTHIDHVEPLYFEGTNEFSNLVLSCRRCNLRKWISNTQVTPKWVKDRFEYIDRHDQLLEARKIQKRQLQELVQQEIDEQIINSIRSWIL